MLLSWLDTLTTRYIRYGLDAHSCARGWNEFSVQMSFSFCGLCGGSGRLIWVKLVVAFLPWPLQLNLLFGSPLLMGYGIVVSAIGLTIPLMYSCRRGFVKSQWMKYHFYIYYPLRLMVILLTSIAFNLLYHVKISIG